MAEDEAEQVKATLVSPPLVCLDPLGSGWSAPGGIMQADIPHLSGKASDLAK
jgi:hypothetical protein